MTSHRTYTVEPQRYLRGGGYKPCEPHQADRFVVLEITHIPRSKHRHAQQRSRNVQFFSGASAQVEAYSLLATLVAKSKPKPRYPEPERRPVIASSLTRIQYEEVIEARDRKHSAANPLLRSKP